MRLALLPALLLLLAGVTVAQPPDCYHSLDDVHEHIFNLQETYPEYVRVDSIGHSVLDNLPIYLVKISDNVDVDEDEPATLFIGHIHGEEILGIELMLAVMDTLLTNPRQTFAMRRALLENYFIVTMNPEGLNVVFGVGDDLAHGPDVTYRKNKRDNVGDGVFRYQLNWGNDSSGVDLNRNWDLHFYQGDTLFHYTTDTERYDYFRGTHPFSEPEAQAVRWAFENVNPMYGATYHSSRQGGLSEKVFYPWDWGNDGLKTSPDQDVLDNLAIEVGHLIPTIDGLGTYQALRSSNRKGKMHDWAYAAGGWFNLEIELANRIIQPNCTTRDQIVRDGQASIWYMMDRAMGLTGLATPSGQMRIIVEDQNGEPLVAEVMIPNRHNRYLQPRLTDPIHGVIRRPMLAGNYTVVTRKYGYHEDTRTVSVGSNGTSTATVVLEELPRHNVLLRAFDGDDMTPLSARMIIHRAYGIDTLDVDTGEYPAYWPAGHYVIDVWADGYIPQSYSFELNNNHLLEAYLVEPGTTFEDDFESDLPARWTTGGDVLFERSNLDSHSGSVAFKSYIDPIDGAWNVPPNSTCWAQVSYDVPTGSESLTLTGWYKYELEPDYDFAYVELRTDGGDWAALDTLNSYSDWYQFLYDFRDHREASTLDVRWRVVTDATDTDRGLFLDDIALMSSVSYVDTPETNPLPHKWSLDPGYPNPFNPSTTIRFEVKQTGHVKLAVFDVLGRQVAELVDQELTAGRHARLLDMSGQASGIYFIRMSADGFVATRKAVLMK